MVGCSWRVSARALFLIDCADFLRVVPPILHVRLSCQLMAPLGDGGAQALSIALKANTGLLNLELSSNSIGDDGAFFLAGAIKVNKTLQVLTLSNNKIGCKGASFIGHALKINTTLLSIDLSANHVADAGSQTLCDSLKVCAARVTVHVCM